MPHDPATMSLLFSIGHWLTGTFVFPIGALVAWQSFFRRAEVPGVGVPLLLAAAGATLALYIVFHAGADDAARMLVWALGEPQQLQHFAFAALLVAMGAGEWMARKGSDRAALVWPTGYLLLGAAFVIHEQIGEDAHAKWLYHVALGTAIMGAGGLRLAQRRCWLGWRAGGLAFASALLVVGILLVSYREDEPLHAATGTWPDRDVTSAVSSAAGGSSHPVSKPLSAAIIRS